MIHEFATNRWFISLCFKRRISNHVFVRLNIARFFLSRELILVAFILIFYAGIFGF